MQLWRSDPTAVAFVVAGSYLCCSYGGWVLPLLLSDDLTAGPAATAPELQGPTAVIIVVAVWS
jgi:hypothetical protein